MIGRKLIAAFAETAAQLVGAADTIITLTFGAAANATPNVVSMGADGILAVNSSLGRVAVKTTLNLGGAVTDTATVLLRYVLNDEQVGDTVPVLVPVGSSFPVEIEHTFDSLVGGDELHVEMVLDAASSATDVGTVLTAGTSNAATWTAASPAKLEIYG